MSITNIKLSIMKWLFGIKVMTVEKKVDKPVPEKDPNDGILSESSTPWKSVSIACPDCLADLSHNEFMTNSCNTCGSYGHKLYGKKMWREIFYQGRWQYQIRIRKPKGLWGSETVDIFSDKYIG